MKVVLAEKPSVAKSIANVLGVENTMDGYIQCKGYIVTWAFGHLVKLAEPEVYLSNSGNKWSIEDLPIIPKEFSYVPDFTDAGKRKQFNVIKKLFDEAEEIICATDAGREGEAIFRYIYDCIDCKKTIKRLWITSLTDSAIRKGFQNLLDGENFLNLYSSAKARAEADWLIGMNATRALTLVSKSSSTISVGRVQTPTLAMICERYNENKNFTPTPYYTIKVELSETGYSKLSFFASLPNKFESREDAQRILDKIPQELLLSDVQTSIVKEKSPLPFDLTSVQAEANQKYKFKAQKTLDIIQKLYESKLVTYPRTGSRYLAKDMLSEITENLDKLASSSKNDIKDVVKTLKTNGINTTIFNDSKLTDHHAIIPTFESFSFDDLTEDELKVYQMIHDQFVMSMMQDCFKKKITYSFDSGIPDYVLTAVGYTIEKVGWRDFPGKRNDSDEEQRVPSLNKGVICAVLDKSVNEKLTIRPPLLTEATLLKKMETAGKDIEDELLSKAIKECGLGTPATRASIIETLYKREYIINDNNHLIPTSRGMQVYEIIRNYPISDVETTGKWEYDLNKIADGELSKDAFDERIKNYTRSITQSFLNLNIQISENKKPIGKCPKCGKDVVDGKKSYYCSGYSKEDENGCSFGFSKEIASKTISFANAKSLLSSGKTGLISGFKSSSGKNFDAMLVLDEDYKVSFEFPKMEKTIVGKCPKCGKDVVEGKKSYYCSGYSKEDENGCSFGFSKEIASKTISFANAKSLLSGGKTGFISGFKSSSGKNFDAMLVLDEDCKVSFEFKKK